jgi:hypothetical protein
VDFEKAADAVMTMWDELFSSLHGMTLFRWSELFLFIAVRAWTDGQQHQHDTRAV